LRKLPRDLPVYTPVVARPWVRALGGLRNVTALQNCTKRGRPTRVGQLTLTWCRATAPLDTTHNALIIRGVSSGTAVMYSPHGVLLEGPTLAAVERHLAGRLDALLVSFTHLDLPGYLGGVANLGAEAAGALVARLRPRFVMTTHDAEKSESGF